MGRRSPRISAEILFAFGIHKIVLRRRKLVRDTFEALEHSYKAQHFETDYFGK